MSMDDDRISQLLRSAFPPPSGNMPSHDLWRRVEGHLDEPVTWSWVDVGLAAFAAAVVLAFPGSFFLLAYHL